MSYIRKLLKVLLWPVIFIAGQFFIKYLFVSFYNSQNIISYRKMFPNLSDVDIVKTLKYQTELNNYLNTKALIITLITFIIFGVVFILKNKSYQKEHSKLNLRIIISIALLGIFISLFYNIFIYSINNSIHITDNYYISSVPLVILIITSGIMGPILEELLFRGIVYNKLLTFNDHKKACIITSIMFSIMHYPNIINIIYTFILSFILIYLYDKYKSLKAPIILHIAVNTTINLFLPILLINNIFINYVLQLISLLGIFIIVIKYCCKD